MKSVRPALAVAVGALSIILLPLAITGLVLGAVEGSGYSWWGFGGCISLALAAVFGMVGGFGRIRWALVTHWLFAWLGTGFAIATCALMWSTLNAPFTALTGLQIAETVIMFTAAVLGFITGSTAMAAAFSRQRDINAANEGPAWVVEEKAKANIIRANRVVACFAIVAMIFAVATLICAAIENSYSSWWAFGGACGIVLASIFGIAAGFRARRGMHIVHAILMFTAVAFTLVGVGAFFHGARLFANLTPLQIAVCSLGFIASVFGFIAALVSSVTVFMYRRRLLPTTNAGVVAAPAVVAAPVAMHQTSTTTTTTVHNAPLSAPGMSPRAVVVEPIPTAHGAHGAVPNVYQQTTRTTVV